MTIYLTDPAKITGSVVALTLLAYAAVFGFALAVATYFRRRDRRCTSAPRLRLPLSHDDALELVDAMARARDQLTE